MNLLPVQYQTIREVRQIVQQSDHNRQELHRMHSAFGAGLRPTKIRLDGRRLWVAVEDKRPGFRFNV